ncbi:MAG: hypothetical protein HWN69_00925 [Desulfobacterales bacterium]|nr:hypothetical protein [Desulfobacterales bacterium]
MGLRARNRETRQAVGSVSVEIYEAVLNRIQSTIGKSDFEEGGKLLGRLRNDGRNLLITVESYIDSGPGVSHSATHLHPNGEYQERAFRLVEAFDSEIEHLGSWHSHHCNGLPELSNGDISGYIRSVNNPQYNLDYFVVILINGLVRGNLEKRYFLFERHKLNEYIELSEGRDVKIIHRTSQLDPILASAESLSNSRRRQVGQHFSVQKERELPPQKSVNPLNKIRLEDKEWIIARFPNAKLSRSKADGSVYWNWFIWREPGRLQVSFKYPTEATIPTPGTAYLEIRFRDEILVSEDIALDRNRFGQIQNRLNSAEANLKIKFQKNTTKTDVVKGTTGTFYRKIGVKPTHLTRNKGQTRGQTYTFDKKG